MTAAARRLVCSPVYVAIAALACGSAPAGDESSSGGSSESSGTTGVITPTTGGSTGDESTSSGSSSSESSSGESSSGESGSGESSESSSSGEPVGDEWLRSFGAPDSQRPGGLGFTPAGELWVAGDVIGAIDLGTGMLAGEGSGIYLGKFAADGSTAHAQALFAASGEPTFTSVTGLAVDSTGAVIVTGWLEGSYTIGGADLSAEEIDVFVGKWDVTGAPVWGVEFGAVDWQVGYSLAVGPDDAVWLAGAALAPFEAGDIQLAGAASTGMFVIRLDAAGTPTLGRWWGEMGDQEARAVAVCDDGSVALAGFITAPLVFGADEVEAAGEKDMFVARIDPEGEPLWIHGLGGASTDYATHVDCDDGVLFAGAVTGAATFGALELTPDGDSDAVLGRYDLDGALEWAAGITGLDDQMPGGITTHPNGGGSIVVSTTGATLLGETMLPGLGERDVVLARYAAQQATPTQVVVLGGRARQTAGPLALHDSGAMAVALTHAGTLAWEDLPPVSATGPEDLGLLRWVPAR